MANLDREILTRRIRDSVDIVALVSSYVRLSRAGVQFKGLCPFHEEKTPSFYVHPAKGFFKCYGCGAGGDAFNFIQLKEKVDFVEARRILAEQAGIDLAIETSRGGGPAGPGKSDLARANQWAQQVFRRYFEGSAGEAARAYVAKRGISPESVQSFGIGLAVDSFDALIRQADQARIDLKLLAAAGLIKESPRGGYYDTFRNRLMFPIADATGRVIAFGGRTLGDDPAKYLNTPATPLFDKSSSLFGLDKAREPIGKAGRVIVVEGYTDCIMCHQFGFPETVATLGTAMTDTHANLLRRYSDRVVLLFDSDEAGQRAADRGLSVSLIGGLDVTLARVPEGKDPCDYLLSGGREGFENVLKAGVPALEFKWRLVLSQYEAGETGPSRRRAIEAFVKDLSAWLERGSLDSIQKGLVLNQLSKLLAVPVEELHRQLPGGTGSPRPRSSAGPSADSGSGRLGSSEQEALRQILEVLLNEPEYYASVADFFDTRQIRDPELAAVADGLLELMKGEDSFSIVDLIGRFESPVFGALITDLQIRGERRGNYGAVIEGALACLRSCQEARRAVAIADEIRDGREVARHTGGEVVPSGEDERLNALAESARNPHFSPARARRRILDA